MPRGISDEEIGNAGAAVIIVEPVNGLCHGRNLPAACHTVFSRSLVAMRGQDAAWASLLCRRDQDIYRHPDIRFCLQQNFLPDNSSEKLCSLQELWTQRAVFHLVHSKQFPEVFSCPLFPPFPFLLIPSAKGLFSSQPVVFFHHPIQTVIVAAHCQDPFLLFIHSLLPPSPAFPFQPPSAGQRLFLYEKH